MIIKNTTTGQDINLTYNGVDGCDALPDIVNEGSNVEMSAEDITWWTEWVSDQEAFDSDRAEAMHALPSDEHGDLRDAIEEAQAGCDMEAQPKAGSHAIREFMLNRNEANNG